MPEVPVLNERFSGYAGAPIDWQAFLSCWASALPRKEPPDSISPVTLLSKFTHLSASPQPTEAEMEAGIQRLQARLQVQLPRSYTDFLRAYRPPTYRPHQGINGSVLRVGIYAVDQVDRLDRLEPQLIEIAKQFEVDAKNATYYVYGVGQDDVAVRTKYRQEAIVVGSHGHEIHDLILLYPQERTRDGEMEATLLFHSGEFRAPSFAELMRQVSYMETHPAGRVPPYSQALLSQSCAKYLPLRDVWWK